jgi:hypothetical protein
MQRLETDIRNEINRSRDDEEDGGKRILVENLKTEEEEEGDYA